MNCRQVERRLSSYLEDRLSRREAGAVAAHLRDCGPCRRYRDDILAVEAALAEQAVPIPPPGTEGRAVRLWMAQREARRPRPGTARGAYSVFDKGRGRRTPLPNTEYALRSRLLLAPSARRSLFHAVVLTLALLLAVLGLELPAAGGAPRSHPSCQALLPAGLAGHGSNHGEV